MAKMTEVSKATTQEERSPKKKKWYSGISTERAGLIIAIIVLSAIFGTINPNFFSYTNITNVMRQVSVLAIVSVGQTLAIMLAGIDLSVGSILGFISVFGASQIVSFGILPGILIALLAAAAIGAFQGYWVAKFKIPAFIVTLGGLSFLRGAAYVYSNGMPISGLPSEFLLLGSGSFMGIPIPAIIALIVYVVFHFMLTRTRTGRYLYAIGGNEEAAVLSGIKVARYKVFAYCMSGLLAGLASIILTSRVVSGQPTLGEAFELQAIAATIIGGTSFSGGQGTLVGTFLGVVLMAIIGNGLNLIRVSSFIQMMVLGAIIVFAVTLDTIQHRKTGK
jgi:ribose/xylose/arabinose/galactoside ABC-type transport system permease subunit